MENIIITLILTVGAVVMAVFVSRTAIKFRETNTQDLQKKLTAANQRVSYWKGKYNALENDIETEIDEGGDLGDLGDLADLDLDQLTGLPVIGKLLKNPKYRKMAQDFLKGVQTKKGTDQGDQDQGQEQFLQ